MVTALLPEIKEPFLPFPMVYQRHGYTVRLMEPVTPLEMPEPERMLLVHDSDMTNTLQTFYEDDIHLRVLNQAVEGDILTRLVVLELDDDNEPVEFGAIQIDLTKLDEIPRLLVEEGRLPFGGILNQFAVQYHSEPSAYFRMKADGLMQRIFNISPGPELYGRCNTLSMSSGEPIAHVIEILPPGDDRVGETL
ncbi:MAG: hypothetical protein P9L94_02140 [Candidatus Hinthialibacter antarcticus]|nr:hypothetical protein [Candidatus Hinthialibacter antarcticus]